MTTSPEDADRAIVDVVVVGAGPAGVAAAVTAAESGASVTLLDSGARAGGQFYRRPASPEITGAATHPWPAFDDLESRLVALERTGAITRQHDTVVWSASGEGPFVIRTRGGERTRDELGQVVARTVVVATGAYDRALPFPGWHLPGVMSGGAAQTLVKSSGVLPGRRIVVAGTGPFLLAVSGTLLEAGAEIAAVVEANAPDSLLLKAPALLGAWGRSGDLARYVALLARNRVPYLRRHRVVEALGGDSVNAVRVATVDAEWRRTPGETRLLECDALAVGFGFGVQHELLGQLGCELRLDAGGAYAAFVDAGQRTTVRGVLACGETTGIGGADLAMAEGLVAGASAAQAVGLPPALAGRALASARGRVRRLRTAQDAMHGVFAVEDGWQDDLRDDTVVCRCEEVTAGVVRDAIDTLGASDARTVKSLTRAGMGWCQGRVCGYAVDRMCASAGGPASPAPAKRPLVAPVSLGALADSLGSDP